MVNFFIKRYKEFTSVKVMRILWFLPICSALRNGLPFNAPVFDPSVVAKGIQPSFLREAELKHGRLAMVSSLLLPLSELGSHTLGIHQFETLPNEIQFSVGILMFMSEFRTLNLGWDPTTPFRILDTYTPGDFGFGLPPAPDATVDSELNHGRVAMLGMLGMMAQELVTQHPLF
jgi:hypothetical protein